MLGARWTALVAVVAIAVLAVGCGSSGSGTTVRKVAIVTPGAGNDVDWTLMGRAVFEEQIEKRHLRGEIADGAAAGDIAALLERLSHDGTQLVIAHEPRYASTAAQVADKTKVPELVWGDASLLRPGRVGVVEVDVSGAGYMAGVIAAHSAILRNLGVMVIADGTSWELRNWNLIAGGFIAGARAAVKGTRVSYARAGAGGSATRADVVAAGRRLSADGAQMFAALGGHTADTLMTRLRHGDGEHQLVGVIGDKATIDDEQLVLTSVTFNFKPAFEEAIRDVRSGSFGKHVYRLTLANGGIRLLKTGRTPADAYEDAQKLRGSIVRGALSVPVTPTEADVLRVLHEG